MLPSCDYQYYLNQTCGEDFIRHGLHYYFLDETKVNGSGTHYDDKDQSIDFLRGEPSKVNDDSSVSCTIEKSEASLDFYYACEKSDSSINIFFNQITNIKENFESNIIANNFAQILLKECNDYGKLPYFMPLELIDLEYEINNSIT